MAASQQRIIDHLRRTVLVRDGAGLTDGQLLECFIVRREEAAFAALVRRHGPMVLSVCRRVLRNSHDAEDAFQATFLVLARKASSIRSKELVSSWLYGVAYQTALKATVVSARRQARERQMHEMPEPEAAQEGFAQDWQPLLDQELHSLPDKYRVPMILCDLEGKSRREAAQQLSLPEGTLSSRLARARTMLAKRLLRHGVTLSGGALATVLAQNVAAASVPALLLGSTVKAGTAAVVSAKVAALADGVVKAMLWAKLKSVSAVLLFLGLLIGGAGLWSYPTSAVQRKNVETEPISKNPADDDREKLQGTWVLIGPTGPAAPPCFADSEEDQPTRNLFISGARLSTRREFLHDGMTFTLDPTTTPRGIDLRTADGKIVCGIYQLDGEELQLCFSVADKQQRPGSFAGADRDADVALWVFVRQKILKIGPELPAKTVDMSAPPPIEVARPQKEPAHREPNRKSCIACHGANHAVLSQRAGKIDLQKLQGGWQLVTVDGVAVADQDRFILGNRFCTDNEFTKLATTFTLHAGKKVRTIDLKTAEGKIMLGIYRLQGDELKIYFHEEGVQKRPVSFAAAENDPEVRRCVLKRRAGK